MEKENSIISQIQIKVKDAYEKYLKAVLDYARNQISKEEFAKEVNAFKSAKEEVLKTKCDEFDPALCFAYSIEKDKIREVLEPEFKELAELRKDGEDKVYAAKEQIINIYLRKNISSKEKKELVKPILDDLKKAKEVQKQNEAKVKELVKRSLFISKEFMKVYRHFIKVVAHNEKLVASKTYKDNVRKQKASYNSTKHNFKGKERRFAFTEHRCKINQFAKDQGEVVEKAKHDVHDSYLALYSLKRDIKNNRLSAADKLSLKWENYKYKFSLSSWLMKNSLYIVILIFFIACMIIAQSQGNPLLTTRTIETIFIQSSTKVFFALGVAGLILLGGTDLSVGRMTGMAASFSCMIMSQLVYETNIGVIDMRIPQILAVVLGIFVCVLSTTLFSALAGFFTSKFKMHPFITTLSTQLLIYGLMMVCFSQVPAFTMNRDIKAGIVGENGWRLILYAVAIIAIVWFIWNKTKFGKNMYAVGDNKEAAAVSGINVFWVTMGVFIMAGILYGLGGFLEGARIGNANPSTALGTELDAIAACVIGGVSFSGGKGKVSGVVVGTIIFSMLTYCLTYIGLDINFQFIFKGIIILAAVCLDSLKFIRKK